MAVQSVTFIDQGRNAVAKAQVSLKEGRFSGVIDLSLMPALLRQKFEEYDELVNGQMFNLADELEGQIDAFALKVVFDEGREVAIEDLQIYPSTRRVSFKVVQPAALDGTACRDGSLRP